jgi:hypothetical protein
MRAIVLLVTLTVVSCVPLTAQQNNDVSIPATAPQTRDAAQSQSKLPDAPQPQKPSSKQERKGLPAILAPQMTMQPMNSADKMELYVHQAFNPVAFILPTFGVGLTMADPPAHYPREWKDGAGAFGRLYGDSLAKREAQLAAQALTKITLHEDPRYLPAASHNVFNRVAHAVIFVLVDKNDSGDNRLAYSNFTGAAARGFVGMGYLPDGYNDLTHAGQRAASTFQDFALSNIANEFCPQWGPLMNRMHLPFVHPPCEERIKAKPAKAAKPSVKTK